MDEQSPAQDAPHRLTTVRIVYLPPATVAASHYVGPSPEGCASEPLDRFVRESGLARLKPDLRRYGFNHPDPSPERSEYGYETWVTVPDGFEVPTPLVKKRFAGGRYAAHAIAMGQFEQWEWLCRWVRESPRYEENCGDPACMHGLLEEVLNYVHHVDPAGPEAEEVQLDLLFPIRLRQRP
ncbi:MAG: GyrI-like domain-containing protein [Candidatus Latescibacterota bacterium]